MPGLNLLDGSERVCTKFEGDLSSTVFSKSARVELDGELSDFIFFFFYVLQLLSL